MLLIFNQFIFLLKKQERGDEKILLNLTLQDIKFLVFFLKILIS